MSLQGNKLIVTGAAGAIGAAAVTRFVTEGASVLAVDFDESGLNRLTQDTNRPGTLETHVADVSDDEQVAVYAAHAQKLWGEVDGLFNNAGIEGPVAPVQDYPLDAFDKVFAVNVRGAFLGMKHVLPLVHDGGSVVNVLSAHGLVAVAGVSAYVAFKHAIVGLTKSVELEQAGRKSALTPPARARSPAG